MKSLEIGRRGSVVPVFGHTDSIGGMEINRSFPERQANTRPTFLLVPGLEHDRVSLVGCGGQDPAERKETEAGRQADRRIAICASGDGQTEMMNGHGRL